MPLNHHSSSRRPKLVMLIAGLVGIATLALGIWLLMQDLAFSRNAVATDGRVVEMQVDTSGTPRRYKPMFEFKDQSGQMHRAAPAQQSEHFNFARDQLVPILYDPSAPENLRVNNGNQPAEMGVTFIFGSLIFFVPAVLAFLVHRRRKAASPSYATRTFLPEDEGLDEQISRLSWGYGGWFLHKPKKMAWILGSLGAFFLVAGVSTLVSNNSFMKAARPATATVLSVETDGAAFRPTVGFKTEAGAKITARSQLSDSSYNFTSGQQIPIYYNPENPSDIRLKGAIEDGIFAYAVIAFAVILLGLTLYALLIHRSFQAERLRRAAAPKEQKPKNHYSSSDS